MTGARGRGFERGRRRSPVSLANTLHLDSDAHEELRTVFGYGGRDARGAPEHLWREGSLLRRRD
jgi:hypothetical protein